MRLLPWLDRFPVGLFAVPVGLRPRIGLGIATGPIVVVMARYKWWGRVPFSIGFWSFSFPLAALTGAVIEVIRRGGWPPAVGGAALAAASTAVAFLALKTIALIGRNQLIPALPPA
jgi:tellurite resistance protein